jgi:hypothetical protein
MGELNINISFLINEEDKNLLVNILGVNQDQLSEELQSHTVSALEEYINMYLGKNIYKRGSDIQENKLYLLIKNNVFDGIPTEKEVSKFFQTTISQSRTLLRAVNTKYQYKLRNVILENLKKTIEKSNLVDGDYELFVESKFTLEELDILISSLGGEVAPIKKKRDTSSIYIIPSDTYQRIIAHIDGEI